MHLIQEEDSPSSKQQTHEMGLLQVRKKWCYGCNSTATKIIARGPPDATDHGKGILYVQVVPDPTKQQLHTKCTKILCEMDAT